MQHVDVAIAVIVRDGKVLITRRSDAGPSPGCWEFPGGKMEAGESAEQCVIREVMEELTVRVRAIMAFSPVEYSYPQFEVTLHPFLCRMEDGSPGQLTCKDACWVEPDELRRRKFPDANRLLIEQVLSTLPHENTVSARSGRRSVTARAAGYGGIGL